ncbi:MAG: YceI family protein [Actinomycetota bacterium]
MGASAEVGTRTRFPTAGTYGLDPAHTSLGFVARHLMVARVRGRFTRGTGTLHIGDSVEDSWAEAAIEASSIDTREEQRDGHLKSPDFLDVERYPELRFRTTGIEAVADDRYRVEGELTIKDVTRPIELDATFDGEVVDPWGNTRVAFSATAEVNREDWGMTWNVALETGGVMVSKKVNLEIDFEAVLQQQ